MKKLFLTDGGITLVSDIDFLFLSGYNWCKMQKGYVVCSSDYGDGINGQFIHRIIAGKMNLDLRNQIDHIDRNPLNNQRNNLRAATGSRNQANSNISVANTSGYKGVCWHKKQKKWIAQICVSREHIHLGTFDTPEEASEAYNQAADHYHGEFANY